MSSVASRAVRKSDRRAHAVVAEPAAHLEPVEVGQHHVEHDEVGRARLDGVERVAPDADRVHLEALVAERRLEHRAQVVLVVDEQESFACHPGSVAGRVENRL